LMQRGWLAPCYAMPWLPASPPNPKLSPRRSARNLRPSGMSPRVKSGALPANGKGTTRNAATGVSDARASEVTAIVDLLSVLVVIAATGNDRRAIVTEASRLLAAPNRLPL
jgi:hypothetical protein